jgi:hypothetical protein
MRSSNLSSSAHIEEPSTTIDLSNMSTKPKALAFKPFESQMSIECSDLYLIFLLEWFLHQLSFWWLIDAMN